jgi:hypothetical protein
VCDWINLLLVENKNIHGYSSKIVTTREPGNSKEAELHVALIFSNIQISYFKVKKLKQILEVVNDVNDVY